MQVHEMLPADCFQVCKVIDDCGLITAEGEIDEIFNRGNSSRKSSCLKLKILIRFETLQPLGQIVQLIDVDFATLSLL